MRFEGPPKPTPEQIAKIEKQRTLSDEELLKSGAEYKVDERGGIELEPTGEQIEATREEMGTALKMSEVIEPKILAPEGWSSREEAWVNDPEYLKLEGELSQEQSYSPGLFADNYGTDSLDVIADREFRNKFPEKALFYDEQKRIVKEGQREKVTEQQEVSAPAEAEKIFAETKEKEVPLQAPQKEEGISGKSPQETRVEKAGEKPKPKEIKTAMGSVYHYLPDGKTQRFKTAEGKMEEPQDTITFIPPVGKILEKMARGSYPKILDKILDGVKRENDPDKQKKKYEQILLEYAQLHGRTIRVVDKNLKELKTAQEVADAEEVFLNFVDKNDSKNSFTLPVSKEPVVGHLTFDTRKYNDPKTGETMRERHIGNAVTEITYEK